MTGPFTLLGLSGAVLSDDRLHRYWLWRIWDRSLPVLVTCMFNPSEADERKDDPTIQNLCKFAKRWGYGGVLVVNLKTHRTPSPVELRAHERRGNAQGDAYEQAWSVALDIAAESNNPVLAAWGNYASEDDTAPFLEKVRAAGVDMICLGVTRGGSPKHPMARGQHRIPDDQKPVRWAA